MTYAQSTSADTIVFNGQSLENYTNRTVVFGQTLYVCGRYADKLYLSYERLRQPQELAIEGTALFDSLREKCDNAILTATFNNVCPDTVRTGATLTHLSATIVGNKSIRISGNPTFDNNIRPTALPDLGDGRLLVCAANLRYYCPDWEGTFSAAESDSDFMIQHTKLTKAFAHISADIYAITEIQNGNHALVDIVDGLNTLTEFGRYTYVHDNDMEVNTYTKVGFIYRTDKVRPVLDLGYPYHYGAYHKREYVQAFEELATGERFILSMNHFKAQEGEGDTVTNAIRMQNAEHLVNFLEDQLADNYYQDSDILIVGDLNCSTMAEPIRYLSENGYENQLSIYAPDEYSYVYYNEIEYLDHVFASPSLASQITGACPYHLNADESYIFYFPSGDTTMYRYSDHDPVLIAMNLHAVSDTAEMGIDDDERGAFLPGKCRINSRDGRIFIENMHPADVVIYDLIGRPLYRRQKATRCIVSLKPALYIVKSGNEVKKVIVR